MPATPQASLTPMRRGLFLVSLPIFFINFSVPVQAKQLGATALEIGLMFSIFTLAMLGLRPVVGWGLDRFGRKPFLVVAAFSYLAAHLCFALSDTLTWMYVARFAQGIGAALLLITIDTMTTDLTSSETRATMMGRNLEVQTRASIVGATIGFTFVGAVPLLAWQYSFGIFAMTTLAAAVYLLLRVTEPDRHEVAVHTFHITPALRKLAVIVFLAGFANALIQPIYLIYLQDRFELPMTQLAWAFLPAAIVFAFVPSRAGWFRDRIGDVNLLVLAFLLSAMVYVCIPFLDSLVPFVLLYTFSAAGWALAEPARKAVTAATGDAGSIGRTFGMTELYAGLGATLGPPIGGIVYDAMGAAATFGVNAGVLVLAAMLTWLLIRQP